MLSIGKLVASQASYYTEQLTHSVGEDRPVLRAAATDQVDYYSAHESPSRWMGGGLGRLDLPVSGEVDKEVFAKLMNHQTPGGESMTVARANRLKVAALDLTFSAPKSVSLLFAFGNEEVRQAVVEAHQRAVSEALSYMEGRASQSRLVDRYRDSEGSWKMKTRTVESEGYLAGAFDHYTSRANDPQVHTHVVVINRVWADGGWRAIDAKRAYAHAKAGGTVYQALLRDQLTSTLGVSWKPVANGMADIDGFSPELIRHFSTRRSEIVEAVNRFIAQHGGEPHRRVWQTFTLETRQVKSYQREEAAATRKMKDYGVTGTVESAWYQKAIDAPDDVISAVERVVASGRHGLRPTAEQVAEAAASVTEWVTDRQAVFTERDLVAQVAALYPDGATTTELTETTRLLLHTAQAAGDVLTIIPATPGELTLPEGITLTPEELDLATAGRHGWVSQDPTVRFRALPGEARYTTRLHLERERQVLEAVKDRSPVAADPEALEDAITGRGLIEGQVEAVRHLARLDGRLVAVVGPGGSGKTYSIGAYADAVAAAGNPVIGVATSAAAARKLGEDLGERWTGTIAMLRHHLDPSDRPLNSGTVIIVDEASMVSTADLAWLVDKVEGCDGKLVLVGDPKQLPSVDSGGLFHRIVAGREQVVDELVGVNQRQQLDLDRHNLIRLRAGEIEKAVHDYAEAGRLHLGRDEYATKAAMVDTWWQDVQHHGLDQVRMLASRHDEVWMLNQLARVRMQQTGELTGPVVANRWGIDFQAGDRIVVRDNWYAHADLRNGQTGTILSVNPNIGSLTFRRDLDGAVIELPKRYLDRNVDHAYAQTIHTAQGQTFQATHVYIDTGVQAEHGYTALSRAKGETHLWVNDSPGPLGECTYIHGDPLSEDRVAALARQLSQSVIEPPAHDQGLPVETATDQQLIKWRDELEAVIRRSPIAVDHSDQLIALDAAIEEARATAHLLGTSGALRQVTLLQTERQQLIHQEASREAWLHENASILHRYSAVTEELQHRIISRVAAYQLDPPREIVSTFGPPPSDREHRRQWTQVATVYAESRIRLGQEADLSDSAILQGAPWRDAVRTFQTPGAAAPEPVLQRAVGES